MGRKQLFHLFILSLLYLLASPNYVLGQETSGEQPTATHAEATSQKWHGIRVDTVIGNSKYSNSGFPFLLYNVGTGRFIMQGGDWAMEGRLFFSDFGRQMYLHSTGRINSGITESQNANKNSFCARPPEPYNKDWSDGNYTTINLTTLMDGSTSGSYSMNWTFVPVDPNNPDTCTYYMYLTGGNNPYTIKAPGSAFDGKKYASKYFYLGAAWGECHNSSEGKGDGEFVFHDDDRSCWTTAEVRGNTNKLQLENGDEVEIQKLYQWRIISVDEFIEVLTQNTVGLNPSISSLIKDRDFTRNANDFFEANDWTVSTLADHPYGNDKRYPYTWGDYRKGESNLKNNNQQSRKVIDINESWDSPVRLKEVFDKVTSSSTNDQAAGKKNAKYGYMIFEGVGTITTNFEAPKPGWYEIECAGFCQGNDAYLFARVIPDNRVNDLENMFDIPAVNEPTYAKVTLEKLPFGTYQKNNYENCLEAGKELLRNRDNHRQKVWVLVSQEDFDSGKKTIRLGFRKDQATQSALISGGYYDTDWVCVDDIRASYMGLAPVFFYEDEEDLNYLSHAEADRARFLANEYAPAQWNGRYAGAANLERTFKYKMVEKDGEEVKSYLWNSFSFPIPLTGEQIRHAFGDKATLAKIDGVGTLSQSSQVLDFATVDLMTTENVVEPGHFYLLKPTKEPMTGTDPRGHEANYYDLGKIFFSVESEEPSGYDNPWLPLGKVMAQNNISSYNNANDGVEYANYIQTPGFEYFTVSDGIYNGSTDTKVYAPKGGYAVSNNTIYHLNKDTRIKGFRGWITLTHPIEGGVENVTGMAVDGIMEDIDETTGLELSTIMPATLPDDTPIYDICGRRVGTLENGHTLPRGIYIVNGKKFMVR